jgi:hypothetical protein
MLRYWNASSHASIDSKYPLNIIAQLVRLKGVV